MYVCACMYVCMYVLVCVLAFYLYAHTQKEASGFFAACFVLWSALATLLTDGPLCRLLGGDLAALELDLHVAPEDVAVTCDPPRRAVLDPSAVLVGLDAILFDRIAVVVQALRFDVSPLAEDEGAGLDHGLLLGVRPETDLLLTALVSAGRVVRVEALSFLERVEPSPHVVAHAHAQHDSVSTVQLSVSLAHFVVRHVVNRLSFSCPLDKSIIARDCKDTTYFVLNRD